ncbi:type II toxin-antitoxin system Phd/YefM family antitoxin [Ramlibacter albus]|uniref:Type II toxin-antitoxin system Phd/YefM family antitoxin n=1 Tax=Ramlibacter albus TaxID=2079448 RepID=A0A923S3U9_9BURK|nr:type II toxin-antitoxin system Phd/YefM family antitoxin [Ramlibacter albus]MBC5766806.1 type II toxin-antitoxin system Phd/YefM family antitoxin [Ramlibacter albus]
MEHVEASEVKQNFGAVLARAARGPLAVRRHRKVVAALVPPDWLERGAQLDERRAARLAQKQVEQERLVRHYQVSVTLLSASAAAQSKMLRDARAEVDRWEALALCSTDYIERWREWLALPVKALVQQMCSDADGWGTAMRQNSPFTMFAA